MVAPSNSQTVVNSNHSPTKSNGIINKACIDHSSVPKKRYDLYNNSIRTQLPYVMSKVEISIKNVLIMSIKQTNYIRYTCASTKYSPD